jgi:hypothetical protein
MTGLRDKETRKTPGNDNEKVSSGVQSYPLTLEKSHALHHAGGLKVDTQAYRAGVSFLLKSQLADGTWRVKTRSRPIQQYFESGFPHEKDQFISISASGWATAALAASMGKVGVSK